MVAASHLVPVCLLILCVSSRIALAFECYECGPGKSNCDSMAKVACTGFVGRCATVKYNYSTGDGNTVSVEVRNCFNHMFCDPKGNYSLCKLANNTVKNLTSCVFACCQENLCDPFNPAAPTKSTTPIATSTSSVLVASVGAILLAVVLKLFA